MWLWVSDAVSGLQHVWGWLPQLDPVAFGVDQPGEPAGAFLRLLAVDPDPGRTKLGQHGVQVADAEVEHPRLFGAAEVVGVGGERREHRGAHQIVSKPFSWLSIPRCSAYHWASASGSRARKNMPPMPVTRSMSSSEAGLLVVAEGAPAVILLVIPPRVTPQDRTLSAGRHTGPDLGRRHWAGRHRRLGTDS